MYVIPSTWGFIRGEIRWQRDTININITDDSEYNDDAQQPMHDTF